MIFTDQNKEDFESEKICHIFEQEFQKGEKKVRDYCHFAGEYRSAAHNECNIRNFYYFLSFFTIFTVSSNYHKPRAQSTVFHQLMKSTFHFRRK